MKPNLLNMQTYHIKVETKRQSKLMFKYEAWCN